MTQVLVRTRACSRTVTGSVSDRHLRLGTFEGADRKISRLFLWLVYDLSMDRRTFVTLVGSSIPIFIASSAMATPSNADLPPNTFRLCQQLGHNDLSIRFEEGGFPVDPASLTFRVDLKGKPRSGPGFVGFLNVPTGPYSSRAYIKRASTGHYYLSHIPPGRHLMGHSQGIPIYFEVPRGVCQIEWNFRFPNAPSRRVVQVFTVL